MVRASKQGWAPHYAFDALFGRNEPLDLVRKLMAGVKKYEVKFQKAKVTNSTIILETIIRLSLTQCQNLYFTRDPAAAIGHGLTINKMKFAARRESLFMEYIMRYHPRFAAKIPGDEVPVWFDRYNKFSNGRWRRVGSQQKYYGNWCFTTHNSRGYQLKAKLFEFSEFNKILALPKFRIRAHLCT